MDFVLIPNPCTRECQERSATCHGSCERYEAFAKNREEYREFIHEAKKRDREFNSYMREQSNKIHKDELKYAKRGRKKW